MMQEDYDNLVNSLATKLLEEGPEKAADNEEGSTTPPVSKGKFMPFMDKFSSKPSSEQENKPSLSQTIRKHPVLAAGAIAGADEVLGLFNKILGPHHFGSHAALRGETSGTGE